MRLAILFLVVMSATAPAQMVIDAGEGVPADNPGANLQGNSVANFLSNSGWSGFNFSPEPSILQSFCYPFVQKMNGVPTLDPAAAEIVAMWSFAVMGPREMRASASLGSWAKEIGAGLSRDRIAIRTTVTFFESTSGKPGRLIAGPFVGVGKASGTMNWGAWLAARGLNLDFSQDNRDQTGLQLKALDESIKNLKLTAPAP